jgi:diguanylate cyclase (GGDEF)-like protein/PAS domain S-box-containing protein
MTDIATPPSLAPRVLVIDDNEAIHQDFRKILDSIGKGARQSPAEIALFGRSRGTDAPEFRLDSAYQGQQGLEMVQAARDAGDPYTMAFVDVRMPPGWDGVETTGRIWRVDPDIQIVICTAFSDYSWNDMLEKLGRSDRLVILKKPFDAIEVVLLATSMTEKWRLARRSLALMEDLERRVEQRTQDLVRTSEQLRVSESQYRLLFRRNPHPMWVVDVETLRFLAVNAAAVEHYGYSEQQFLAMSIRDIRPDEDVASLERNFRAAGERGGAPNLWRHRRSDGSIIHVEVSSEDILFDSRPARLVLAHDVSERFEQERKIARLTRIRAVSGGISSAMLRRSGRDQLLQQACAVAFNEGVFPLAWASVLDAQTLKFETIAALGADREALERARPALARMLMRPAHAAQTDVLHSVVINNLAAEPGWPVIAAETSLTDFASVAAFPLLVEGEVVSVLILMTRERGFFDAEEVALLEWLAADLSFALEHIEKSQRLDYLAYFDTLTGLPNVSLFRHRLDQMIHAAALDDSPICVAAVDIERFAQINETLGRGAGDELLRQVGARFADRLAEPYVLGRIGADTFAVASSSDPEQIATRLRECLDEALRAPFAAGGRDVRLSVQQGIALYPGDGGDAAALLKSAEAALRIAKAGDARYAYHSSDMTARIAERYRLEDALRNAVDAQQFVLHFQPRVDMISGQVVGAEALVRWQHPERGLLAPSEFIPLAEETGLIVPLGAWVIDAVCAQQAKWQAEGLAIVPMAVNLSSIQLGKDDLLATVRDALGRHHLEPRQLGLELTETSVMRDSEAAASTLQALRRLGVGLALDDFGTGYSSLAHLKRYPFDSVKIDLSFVNDITRNPEDAAIASAIIAMAHRMGLKVVAEGVETEGQFNYLRGKNCDEMQGHFFAPAASRETFETHLRGSQRMTLPQQAPTEERTLLLVDDEPGIRSALTRLMRPDGYRILTAASGAEGLELLALHRVQVIISDQRMPEMSGSEFLATVKQLYPDTVRIILSGYTDLAVVTDSVNRGAVFKFLTKPWDDDLLREQIRDAFRRYRPSDAGTM